MAAVARCLLSYGLPTGPMCDSLTVPLETLLEESYSMLIQRPRRRSQLCTHMAASPRGFSNLISEARSCHGDSGEPGHKFSVCMQLGSKGRKRPPPYYKEG